MIANTVKKRLPISVEAVTVDLLIKKTYPFIKVAHCVAGYIKIILSLRSNLISTPTGLNVMQFSQCRVIKLFKNRDP